MAQAAECLHNAAEIFDQAGMLDVADEINQTIQSLANDLSGAKDGTEDRMMKHVEQVKHRLASLSGNDGWLKVDSKWLLPEIDKSHLGNPEKSAHHLLDTKGLSPDQFPGAK